METGGYLKYADDIKGGVELAVKVLNGCSAAVAGGLAFMAVSKLPGFKSRGLRLIFDMAGVVTCITVTGATYDWLNKNNIPFIKDTLDILI